MSVVLATAASPGLASANWNEPWRGVSGSYGGINQSPDADARNPVVAVAAGVPYVAWREFDGTNWEVRVARLEGRRWKQPWTGVSDTYGGIGQDADKRRTSGFAGHVDAVSLAAVGDIPYVAWVEDYQLRVARLEGQTWVQPWTGMSEASGGVDTPKREPRWSPSLADADGVAHVAWLRQAPPGTAEWGDGELRAARLTGSSWEQPWQPFAFANRVRLAAVGSVPYAAGYFWVEPDEQDVWVARAGADGWETPWDAPQKGYYAGGTPSLANVDGVPYLAWNNGWGLRVKRLAGSRWENVGKLVALGAPALADIGRRPHIAGVRSDGTNWEVRVTRLTDDVWEEPWHGGVNHFSGSDAGAPSLTDVGGAPYVVWSERDGTNHELRAARLEPDFGRTTVLATGDGALVAVRARTYRYPYEVGLEYGDGLSQATATRPVAHGRGTVLHTLDGLAPATSYRFRPFAVAGPTQPPARGRAGRFTTRRADTIGTAITRGRLAARAGKRVAAEYLVTEAARMTLRVFRRGAARPVARVGAEAESAGLGVIVWDGRAGRRGARPGRYRLAISAVARSGETASETIPLTLKPRPAG